MDKSKYGQFLTFIIDNILIKLKVIEFCSIQIQIEYFKFIIYQMKMTN